MDGPLIDAGDALHENEQRLRLALDAGQMGAWEWEIGTDHVQWSDGHYTLLGYRPGEVEPTPEAFGRRVHPEDHARQEQALQEAIEQHREYCCEFRVVWPDGSVHWLEARGRCVYDGSGAAARMYGVLMDIDARKRIDEALAKSTERLADTLASITDAHFALDDQWRFVEVNPVAERHVFRRPASELIGRLVWDVFPHKRETEFFRQYQRAIESGRAVHFEAKSNVFDGWFEVHAYPRDGRLEVFARDITDRKHAEQALRESEQRFRAVLENSLDVAYRLDLRTRRYDYISPRAERISGFAPEEMGELRSRDLFAQIHPDDVERVREELAEALAEGRGTIEYRFQCKDGRYIWVADHFTVQKDEQGRPEYLSGIARDINEHKRAERILRESEERYHRLFTDDLTGNFIATPEGTITECNPAFMSIYGLEGPPQTISCDISRFNPADWAELTARVKTERRIHNHECTHRRSDGREIRVVANVIGHFTPAGELAEIRGYVFDDTERWRAEQALRESEQRFKSTFENAAVGIAHVTLEGRYLLANGTFCRIVQYSHQELLTKRCLDITHPDDVRESIDNWKRLRDGQIDHYSMEKRYIRKDGTAVWVSHTGSVQRDDEGKPAYFIVIVQDISWRKYTEQMLRESEQRFRKLFEADLMGAYVTRPDGTFLDCNEKMVRMLGYDSREEILQHRSTDFYVDPAFRDEAVRILLRDGIFPGREGLLRRRDGAVIHTLGFAVLLRDERTGEPYIQGVAVDITERKRAEEALREAKEWNERNVARLNAVLHQMTEGLVIFDPAGNLLDMNRAALAIHGFSDAAELRRHLDHLPELFEMFDLQGRPLPTDEWPLGRALRGETFQACEVRVRCKRTGRTWIASYGGTPVRDPEGRLIFAVVTLRDITAQKETERQLRELTATLESKVVERTAELEDRGRQLQKLVLELSQAEDRERKRLAEILHDDLQQQLAAAKFHMGMLTSRIRQDPALREIAVQVGYMLKDAIRTSRSLSHELSPTVMYHGDLGETFEWLAGQIQAKHGLTVRVRADGEVNSQSETLKTFLYRAAQEMLFNVVKHARTREASIRVRRRGRSICLMISDRGRGFDPQGLKAVPGFGLFNIQERVGLLGGRMRIKSASGKGSTFFIAVPDEVGEADHIESGVLEPPPVAETVEPAPAEAHPQPLRVLIADDHEVVRQGLVAILGETSDVEVVGEAGNGREAVDLACHLRPDVVIMDVAMPLMNGDEATRQIRRRLPRTRVVALSMYDEPQMIERMHRAGAQCYVAKTAPSEELLAAVRNEPSCP